MWFGAEELEEMTERRERERNLLNFHHDTIEWMGMISRAVDMDIWPVIAIIMKCLEAWPLAASIRAWASRMVNLPRH